MTVSDGTHTRCSNIGNITNGRLPDKMVDPDWLKPYGISVREADANGTLLAYAPLNIEPGQTGGGKVASRARMPYQLNSVTDWQQVQKGRLVWMVQALTDQCDLTDFVQSEDAEGTRAWQSRSAPPGARPIARPTICAWCRPIMTNGI